MYNTNIPTDRELPSTPRLVRSTILAAAVAGLLLVTVVMPAEYGIDPTGVGALTGLQQMGEIKMSLAREAEAQREAVAQAAAGSPEPTLASAPPLPVGKTIEPAPVAAAQGAPSAPAEAGGTPATRRDTSVVSLQPNETNEVKVALKKGQVVKYVWTSDAGSARFDTHADSKALNIRYHNYAKGASTRDEGTLEAAFDGWHGWFWRNRSGAPLTITLHTEGPYTEIKREK